MNAPDVLEQLRSLEPRYVFVVGWSQICRRPFLELPSEGCIGFHPAPLPENRGRAVLPWTILQRRSWTGCTLFWLDEGVDSGDIILQKRFPVAANETVMTLYRKHAGALRTILAEAIPLLRDGTAPRLAQDHSRASYCAKRTPADGYIDWTGSADAIWTLIRAVGDPYPGAFTYHRGGRLTIWEAEYVGNAPHTGLAGQVQEISERGALVQCGDGQHILLRTVEPDAGGRVPAASVLRNHQRLGIEWSVLYDGLRGGTA